MSCSEGISDRIRNRVADPVLDRIEGPFVGVVRNLVRVCGRGSGQVDDYTIACVRSHTTARTIVLEPTRFRIYARTEEELQG